MARDAPSEEEYTLPSTEVLLGGTWALMTGCVCGCGERRGLLGAKVAANLAQLSQHDARSPDMRRLLARRELRWQAMGQDSPSHTPAMASHSAAGSAAMNTPLLRRLPLSSALDAPLHTEHLLLIRRLAALQSRFTDLLIRPCKV